MTHPAALLEADRRHLWHPYASTAEPGPLRCVTEAHGTRLVLDDGTGPVEVVDAMASWWCQVHGYRNPVLDRALHEQVDRFSHVMFGGLTHAGAVGLAERLVAMTPDPLQRVFLADSGSVAMEVALKLARQYQVARAGGRPTRRMRCAALRGAYHGDTWGVMALCDPEGGMHAMYAGAVEQHLFLPRPPGFAADEAQLQSWAEQARALVHAHRDELAAIVVEPVLQGAGGMWPWAPAALRELRALADTYELLLVADEIATGLGRTGRLWACDWAEVVPDVLVLGKAMTGGYCTQAAVVATEQVARTVSQGCGALMHGPTFMANPLACAVSSASLDLLADGWQHQVPALEQGLRSGLAGLQDHRGVTDVRVLGGTAAVELTRPVDLPLATRVAIEHGVWLRPFRNLVYAMPPYVCTAEDLATITGAMRAVVDALTEEAC
ncbi:adenosylmethionine--8-amino-7-oxononanoate transaminase [Luteococcus peritonei]|uniref:Adenosylmethionine-8-amino-7-oxononanoate aminotransferase n=1 Tax=Luteococcus peritonei TaxID=88874 RepID=A0ABW4RXV7_9ACTN